MRPHIFRAHRESLGLSQDALAAEMGMSKRQIRRYETARAPIPQRTIVALEAVIEKRRPKGKRS